MINDTTSTDFCSKEHFRLLKGIAILIIMLSHAANNSGVAWFTPLGGIGVAIFLFCSGYGICHSIESNSPAKFWLKRSLAIYLEYFLVEIIAAFVFSHSIADVLASLSFIRLSSVYFWYLRYLLVCYLLVWLVLRFLKNSTLQTVILLSAAAISFIIFYTTNNNLYAEQSLSFVSGVLFARYRQYNVGKTSPPPKTHLDWHCTISNQCCSTFCKTAFVFPCCSQ